MVTKVNILIAEDEPHIALALAAIMEKGISGAAVTVVNDGEEALNELLNTGFNIVISDWNMPKITGVELLEKVRAIKKLKDIPFIMLTARGDKGSVVEALKGGVTDYIAKPFENSAVIEKAISLLAESTYIPDISEKKDEEDIISLLAKRLAKGEIEFPVMPDIGMRAAELSKNNDTSISELSKLISLDAALSSKLISVANSAHYNTGKDFDSIEDAISRIGLRDVCNLIVVISNKSMFEKSTGVFAEKLNLLWIHSFATASCAKFIALKIEASNPERMFSIGLLHDIGKLVVFTILFELSKKRKIGKKSLYDTVSQLHVQFGQAIVEKWNMPKDFIDVVTGHHDDGNMAQHSRTTQIVSFANIMVRKLGYSLVEDDGSELADTELARLLNMDEDDIEKVLKQTKIYVSSLKSSV